MKNSVKSIPISAFNTAALLPAVWQAITPALGLPNSCFMLTFKNLSNVDIEVSYDGVNVNDCILADSNTTLDLQVNSGPSNFVSLMNRGTNVFLRGPQGAGFIYLSGYYQEVQP